MTSHRSLSRYALLTLFEFGSGKTLKLKIPLILSSLFLSCCLQNRKPFDFQHANIKSVIFRNPQFEALKNIKTESEIAEFKSQLMFLEMVTEKMPRDVGENWTHKIDIEVDDDHDRLYNGRWLMILVKVI
ncbi:hypothetical protein LEP1GSC074_2248 [Leptospira noguchii str. Hook]|nr:hypothetical protein LEP1GSC074_2248 [Leptospira noguchii str. Hook]